MLRRLAMLLLVACGQAATSSEIQRALAKALWATWGGSGYLGVAGLSSLDWRVTLRLQAGTRWREELTNTARRALGRGWAGASMLRRLVMLLLGRHTRAHQHGARPAHVRGLLTWLTNTAAHVLLRVAAHVRVAG